jgi:hypothetical protein
MTTAATPAHDLEGTGASLPRWTRKLYGAPGHPATDAVTTAALKALYQTTRLAPAQLRYTRTVRQAKQTIREHERHQHTAL